MILMIFRYPPENFKVSSFRGWKHGGYEIFIPHLGIFGWGFRINWRDEYLCGVTLTNRPIPDDQEIEEKAKQSYEQLVLPGLEEYI